VRVSLTKKQQQTEAGIELLQLCQTVTDDGHLSDAEIQDVREWLNENKDCGFESWNHLSAVLDKILADGIVTAEERLQLYKEIVKVLPPDLRELVVARKKEIDRAQKELNSPIDKWDFMVAGVRYEGRPDTIYRYAREGDAVYLWREPKNRFDKNAIAVLLKNAMQIGFVPAEWASQMALELDRGQPHRASIRKLLTAGRSPIPVVVASIYSANSTLENLIFERDVPQIVLPTVSRSEVFWCQKCGNKLYASEGLYCDRCQAAPGLPATPAVARPEPAPVRIMPIRPVDRSNQSDNLVGWALVLLMVVCLVAYCSYSTR